MGVDVQLEPALVSGSPDGVARRRVGGRSDLAVGRRVGRRSDLALGRRVGGRPDRRPSAGRVGGRTEVAGRRV